MLRLARPLPDRFVPAVINPRGLETGNDLIAAGYGKSASNDPKADLVLRMVLLRVSSTFRGWVILVSVRERHRQPAPAIPADRCLPIGECTASWR
jgi:hypothetical protein